jgi:hypothetical protein
VAIGVSGPTACAGGRITSAVRDDRGAATGSWATFVWVTWSPPDYSSGAQRTTRNAHPDPEAARVFPLLTEVHTPAIR